jgi:hypothetical protein
MVKTEYYVWNSVMGKALLKKEGAECFIFNYKKEWEPAQSLYTKIAMDPDVDDITEAEAQKYL